MNETGKNFRELQKTLLLFFFLGSVFIFFNHKPFSPKSGAKSLAQQESFVNHVGFIVSESPVVKSPGPSHPSLDFLEFQNKTQQNRNESPRLIPSEEVFLQIKILLRQNVYNHYFASGLHDPSLEA